MSFHTKLIRHLFFFSRQQQQQQQQPQPQPMPPHHGKKSSRYILYGGVAGITAKTVVAPLERIKVLQQVNGAYYSGSTARTASQWYSFLLRSEPWRALWKGNLGTVLRIGPTQAIRFASYDFYFTKCKQIRNKGFFHDASMVYWRLLAGACAGMTASITAYPLDLVRLRWTIQTKNSTLTSPNPYFGLQKTARIILQEEGILGFYKGMGISLVGVVPYVAANFVIYETLREQVTQRTGKGPSAPASAALGFIAGGSAMTLTFPCDFLHKRMMLDGYRGREKQYHSIAHAATTIIKTEGPRAFLRGLPLSYAKVAPAQAVSWCVIEFFRRNFG